MPQPTNAPAGPRPWYHVGPVLALAADADSADGSDSSESTSADVYVYDVIGGWWGLTADDFVRDVASLDVDTIVLHLNTPGGEVSEGTAIANMLRQHRAHVRVMVDGMAASSGSVIAMAGDEVVMGVGSQMMVHNPKTWAVGDADEMLKVARMLESTADAIASTYAAKAGGTVAGWRDVMKAETWYTADEAVKAGLADRVADDDDKASASGKQVTPGGSSGFWDMWDSLRSQDRLDLSPFNYQGRTDAPAPKLPARQAEPPAMSASAALAKAAEAARGVRAVAKQTTTASPAVADPTEREASVDAAKMREALGLAADASDAEVQAALTTAGFSAAPPSDGGGQGTGSTEGRRSDGGKPLTAAPSGMRLVADSVWDQMQNTIKGLQAHVDKQKRDERDQVIAQAVKDGKFTPAQQPHFTALWDSDPDGTRSLINSLQKNTALATAELGYAGLDDDDAELAEFDALLPPNQRSNAKAGR